jgi:hypothetical protein
MITIGDTMKQLLPNGSQGEVGRRRSWRQCPIWAPDVFGIAATLGTVLCVQDKAMKQAWCLATSSTVATARALMRLYGKRWGIECGFRDTKDLRFGMGMGSIHLSTPARRDRLWLLNAVAIALLTLLGAAGEALGYDRYLKSNTSKQRTHSLFRQGCMLYELIPTMPELRLLPLIDRFAAMLAELPVFADTFGAV